MTEKNRLAVRNAVSSVQEISASLSIPSTREMIYPPACDSVRSVLLKIRQEYPDARFTFDLSGGSKALCMALFAFAPWLGGEVYVSFDEKTARRVPLPDRAISTRLSNPNYQTILAILLRNRVTGKGVLPSSWVSRQYLYQQLWPFYVPSRTKKATLLDLPQTVIQYRRGHKPAAEMSHPTFSGYGHPPRCRAH